MSSKNRRLNELGEFLRARRAELSPRAVGLSETGALRRVPGLRREEVAQLAAISTDYYTRLEQGRLPASASVLATLACVLSLNDDQRAYLFELAGKNTARSRRQAAQKIRPQKQRLLDQLTESPAMILGRRMDILAWNPMAAALITDFAMIPEKQRNYVRLIFTDPAIRRLYDDWETIARKTVASLRMEAAQYPDDPRLSALVRELSARDRQFRRWWAAHHVASNRTGTKTLHHPVVGKITLDWVTLTCAADPDQQLIIWTAEPGTPSHQALRFLAFGATRSPQPAPSTTGWQDAQDQRPRAERISPAHNPELAGTPSSGPLQVLPGQTSTFCIG